MSLHDDEIQACVNYMNAGDLDDLVSAVCRADTPGRHPRFAFWGSVDYHRGMMNEDEKMTMLDLLADMEFESEFADSRAAGVGRFEEDLRGIRDQFLAVLEDNELSKKALKRRIWDILG